MLKREFGVRLLNILAVISYIFIYIEGNVFNSVGFYVCLLYVIYLILKPFMLRQPSYTPFNYIFELFDMLFVILICIFVTPNAILPLGFLTLLRCALLFKIYFVLLSYCMIMIYTMLCTFQTGTAELHSLVLALIIIIIPSCVVCFVKDDAMKLDKSRRELSEKLQLKNAVISELQKYSDMSLSGDPKKNETMMRTDFVTQIPNRYYFEEMLKKGIMRAGEPSFNMGLIMVYIENLYQYRQQYSYSTEHILVKRIHDMIAEQIKSNDFIARYEEDCIAVLLFNKDIANAQSIANIIYGNFEDLKFNEPELNDIYLKIGVNDIENSMKENRMEVDTLKFLNRCKYIEPFADFDNFNN